MSWRRLRSETRTPGGATLATYVEAKMSTKVTIALAAAILLGSALGAAAQVPRWYYDYDYGPVAPGGYMPPFMSDHPAATGGGSTGYNENVRRNDW